MKQLHGIHRLVGFSTTSLASGEASEASAAFASTFVSDRKPSKSGFSRAKVLGEAKMPYCILSSYIYNTIYIYVMLHISKAL